MKRLILITLLAVAIPSLGRVMEFPFATTTDYPAAVAKARAEGKTVLLAFVHESCGHCQALKKNVFGTEAFAKFAEAKLVPVVFDFASARSLPAAQQEKLKELTESHKVDGTPTIVLLRPDETVLLKSVGYGGSSAEEVIQLFKDRIGAQATSL